MEGFDTMNDAPKKIWAGPSLDDKGAFWGYGHWDSDFDAGCTEYTRSDIAQAQIDKLETALTWISLGPSYYETPEGAVLEMMRGASEALKGDDKDEGDSK
jgi:hypothetical protein